jgi:hypothetical protein
LSVSAAEDTVPHIAHEEFRTGVRQGRFRVVIDPKRAPPYVVLRLRVNGLAIVLIGAGAVLALGGSPWIGLVPVGMGVAVHRLTRAQAAAILLRLAERDAAVYDEVTQGGIMEITRA